MTTAVLSSKFQISIPKDVREAMHLKPGQRIAFLRIDATLKLVPVPHVDDLFGIARSADTDNYRDRSTRRKASLPALTRAQQAVLNRKLAKAAPRA